jgi:Ras-related protein Rab-11A
MQLLFMILLKKTFNYIEYWINESTNNSPYEVYLILVGSKIDLKNVRVVSYDEGKKLASKYNMLFFECRK